MPDIPHKLDQAELRTLRRYRLARVREQLAKHDVAGAVLFDPINIRYAIDSSNMQVWTLHNPHRYVFVATEGPVVVFDGAQCHHLSRDLETVDEVRLSTCWFFFVNGPRVEEMADRWADEMADLIHQYGGGNSRLAADRLDPAGTFALGARQIQVVEGQNLMEYARIIKSPEEIKAIRSSIGVAERGMRAMQDALRPGMTENELWSILHQTNIANGGEWIETRLLTSGPRTNPWFQECSDRVIQAGDMVSFDTDMIGPLGYCADLSRSWLCDEVEPKAEQREIYRFAYDRLHENLRRLKAGLSFREFAEACGNLPEQYHPNRYDCVVHGIGLCDEYPFVGHWEDFQARGFDGVFEENMTVCVESYIGAADGHEGVKLEQQLLITNQGVEELSTYPFEDALL